MRIGRDRGGLAGAADTDLVIRAGGGGTAVRWEGVLITNGGCFCAGRMITTDLGGDPLAVVVLELEDNLR